MKSIKKYVVPPKSIKEQIQKIFSTYPYKDFQLKNLEISKVEMAEYLWSTLNVNHDSFILVMFENEKVAGFMKAVPNNFVKKHLKLNSWSIKHLLFSEETHEEGRIDLIKRSLEELKSVDANFIDVKIAPNDNLLLKLLQNNDFSTVGITTNCLINKHPHLCESVNCGSLSVDPAKKQDVDEIHELVKANHKHNHYYYDPRIPIKQVKALYGNLVSKTVHMDSADTLVARDEDGVLRGVVTYKTKPALSKFSSKNLASLDFIAVDTSYRCKGLGDILNRSALKKIYDSSIDTVMVRTMVSNYQALRVLQKLNMKITSSDIILHKWI